MLTNNNIIIMHRGDTYDFDLVIDDVDSPNGIYRLKGNDVVYFGIMDPHQPFENALVKKRFTAEDAYPNGVLNIVIAPEDTLDLLPGTYYYSVRAHLQHDNFHYKTGEFLGRVDQVNTVVNKTKLFLCD
jgi:hypothetical protein